MSSKKDQVKKRKVSRVKPKSKFAKLYIESSRILGKHRVGYPNPNDILI